MSWGHRIKFHETAGSYDDVTPDKWLTCAVIESDLESTDTLTDLLDFSEDDSLEKTEGQ